MARRRAYVIHDGAYCVATFTSAAKAMSMVTWLISEELRNKHQLLSLKHRDCYAADLRRESTVLQFGSVTVQSMPIS